MDDGSTFAHLSNCEKTYLKYSFIDNVLIHERDIDNKCFYEGAEQTGLSKIAIYNVLLKPLDVILKTTGESITFSYNAREKSLTVEDLPLTVYVPGAIKGDKTELIEVVYEGKPEQFLVA